MFFNLKNTLRFLNPKRKNPTLFRRENNDAQITQNYIIWSGEISLSGNEKFDPEMRLFDLEMKLFDL